MKTTMKFAVLSLLGWFAAFTNVTAQLADVTFTTRMVQVKSWENAPTGSCWESGTEEYASTVKAWDDVNGSQVSTGCVECSNNGNCVYNTTFSFFTRTSNAYVISTSIDAWENDCSPNCSYNSCGFLNSLGDDCRRQQTTGYDFREWAPPSPSGTFYDGPTFGSSSNHTWILGTSWRYTGTASLLTPTCSAQNVTENALAIRSHSLSLVAGHTYRFETTSGPDTELYLYSTDGYTVVGYSDDDGVGNFSLITFTPSVTGTYYIETLQYSSAELGSAANLQYQDMSPTPATPGAISGSATVCAGTTGLVYSIGAVADAVSYTWTIPSGWAITAGGTGTSITVTAGSAGGNITVRANGYCGNSGNATLAVTVNTFTTANAGGNQTICNTAAFLAGNAPATGTGTWTVVSGAGSFSNVNAPNATVSGLALGANTFRWTLPNGVCADSQDDVIITRNDPTTANAGGDQTVCATSATLAANTPATGAGAWTVISGTGTFSNSASPTSTVTGLSLGANTFRWTLANGVCADSQDDVIITRNDPTTANAGGDQTVCGTSATLAGNTPATGGGTWTLVSGTGTVTSPTNPSSTVTGLGVGPNTFRWTLLNGVCADSQDDVIITRDNVAPSITCPIPVATGTSPGNCSATGVALGTPVTSDNCGVASTSNNGPGTYSLGTTNVIWTVTDVNGNTATCSQAVTASDLTPPSAVCQDLTLQLDNGGNASTTAAAVNNGSSDACGVSSVSLNVSAFTCANVGANNVVLTVTDVNGNTSTCSATVTVQDLILPVITCPGNVNIQCNTSSLPTATGTATGTDNCGLPVVTFTDAASLLGCNGTGTITRTWLATDGSGNTASCVQTINVIDNTAPTAVCQNVTVDLDNAGNGSTTAAAVNNGSSDNCGAVTVSLSQTTFSCANVGANAVILTVSDACGNTATCGATVTVRDVTPPAAVCQNVTVQLDNSGNASTTASAVNNGSSDACGVSSVSLSVSAFTCANVGANNVVLTVTDVNGNTSTCSATVTVQDLILPVITCPGNVTVQCNTSTAPTATGNATATDNCGAPVVTFVDSPNLNGCNGTGTIFRSWRATDASGNTATCGQVITVIDNTPPVIVTPAQNMTVECDGSGNQAAFIAWYTNYGGATATDNCGAVTMSIGSYIATPQCGFTASAVVTFRATDACGNSSNTTATFNIVDTTPPALNLPANATVQCNTSTAPTATGQATGTDACTIGNNPVFWINEIHYDNSGTDVNEFVEIAGTAGFNVAGLSIVLYDGANGMVYNTVPLTGVIPNQQAGYGTLGFLIPGIQDGNDAIALVAGGIVVQFLSYEGAFTALNGPAAGITATNLPVQEFATTLATKSISLIGTGSVYQQFTWVQPSTLFNSSRGLRNSFQTFVAPVGVTVSFTDVNSLGGCNNTGTITRTWRATDGCGNTTTGVQTINVIDNTAPTAICRNVTVDLDNAGNGSTTAAAVNNGSSDNCGAVTLSLAPTGFTCANVGANAVTLTVSDACGNTSTCGATVTVRDVIPPVAVCQAVTVNLNSAGNGTITASQVNNGSSDACGIASLSLSVSAYTCANVGSGNTTVLTVTDVNGNSSTCSATVTVVDAVPPVALCQNVTVQLDNTGNGSITASQVNNGSTDACGIASLSVNPSTFNCSNVAQVPTELIISEYVEGNIGSNKYIELYNPTSTSKNLGNYRLRLYANGASSPTNDVLLSGTLAAGATIVYRNSAAPVVAGAISNAAVNFNGDDAVALFNTVSNSNVDILGRIGEDPGTEWTGGGNSTLDRTLRRKATVTSGVTANPGAGFPTLATQWDGFAVNDVSGLGAHSVNSVGNTVTLTVTDVNGNTSTCTANVTVVDNVPPVAVCQSVTVNLNASGAGSITASQVNNGSTDACGISSVSVNVSAFTCANVGANTVVLTVTDVNGNSSTCSATVTVQDLVAPVAICRAVTVSLNSSGLGSITPSQVNNGSTDACGIGSLALSNSNFTCANVGANTVVLTVTDVNGNSSTCSATITVQDLVSPVALCQDVTVQLDNTGNGSATAAAVNNGSSDACGIASLALNPTAFTCADVNGDAPTELFISEYLEGSGSNKCLEIFNGTGATVNLSGYSLRFYFNGIATPGTILNLSGSIAPGDVYVICDNDATAPFLNVADFTSAANFFNGNDAVELRNGATSIDIIGRIGEDPGVEWGTGLNSTEGNTLVRNSNIGSGNTANASGFPSVATEWTGFAENYMGSLGTHTYTGNGLNAVVLTVTDVNGNSSTCAANVTVEDNVAPVALCQSLTINIGSTGSSTVAASSVNNGSSDACGIASISLNPNAFTCDDLGVNSVTLTVTDVNGNSSTCAATVTVTNDPLLATTASPTVACGYNVTCNGATNGSASVTATGGCLPYGYLWSNGQTSSTATGLGAGTYTVTVTDVNGTTTTSTVTLTEPALLTSAATSPTVNGGYNIRCNGGTDGSIDLTVGGGASCLAYSFVWSTGATTEDLSGLGAGTYSVTVTDANGCVTTTSITLTEPPLLVTTLIPQVYQGGWNISCRGANDGMIYADVNGGTPAYNFAWSNGATTQMITNLGPGSYTVTVMDANGCVNIETVTLTEPTEMVDGISAIVRNCGYNVSCNGATDGSIDYTVTGGTAPYAFIWSNGATTEDISGLAAGTYSVTATDRNGCTTTETITLTEPAVLTANIVLGTYNCGYNVSCNGASDGNAVVNVSGGCGPYTYQWSPMGQVVSSINGLPAMAVSVTVTDANGCQAFDADELIEPAPLAATGVAATYACGYNVTCNGASNGSIDLSVTGGASCLAYTYTWSNGATTEDVSGLSAGVYTVTVADANGCSTTSTFTLTQPDVLQKTTFSSPVHACGYNISCNGGNDGVINLDVTGGASCLAFTYLWSDGATTEDRNGLAAGNYSVTVTDANGCSFTDGITLTQPALLTLAITSPTHGGYNVSCNGGNDGVIAMTVSGGASCLGYAYVWSNGATTEDLTGLTAGTYSVTVTDANGCVAVGSITLTQPTPVVASAGPDVCVQYGYQTISCTTLVGTQSGGVAPYTVRWNEGSSTGPLVASTSSVQVCSAVTTTYCYTVTDANGCTHTDCMVVNVTDIRCGQNLQKITICHIPPGNGGNPQTLCVAVNAVAQHVPGHGGDYLGACGATDPCTNLKSGEPASSAAAAMDAGEAELTAFPNPFSSVTTVRFSLPDDGAAELHVYSMTGEKVAVLFDGMAEAGRQYEVEWKPSGVSQGIYFAKLITSDGDVLTMKLVLNR